MLTTHRKQAILAALKRDGQVVAKTLSESFGVSEDTLRRDLRELAAEGRLQRVHGGALPASAAVGDMVQRQDIGTDAKRAIAMRAAAMILPGQVVILDGGTTCVQLARCLPPTLAITVVTHSPSVAVELAAHPLVDVLLIGGRLFKHSMVAVGASAVEAMAHIRADVYFMGVTGVHPTAGLSTGDLEEAYVKRALAARAAEVVVLASTEKLGAASPYVIADVDTVSSIVVDSGAPEAIRRQLRARGVDIVVA
ncbi:DeoR/GlpR family DNA-binding transcription regulator [Luteibacter sp. dw_328]|uniref:DeoR/GlpR family DNA-binding transcription regulator n=1 Tax=Luteibacter sp. dw_328 TaxID=2719796 RepID=UPI001BD39B4D|nr:DeoR/GlpR family DNA-binding transcription regulator [Luteibacter sp. dw_328]